MPSSFVGDVGARNPTARCSRILRRCRPNPLRRTNGKPDCSMGIRLSVTSRSACG